jgi:cob(I)alamin adenosyltransferase
MTERTDAEHTAKMKKVQAAHRKIVASKTVEKGR